MVFLEGGKMYDTLTTSDSGQKPFDGTVAIVAEPHLAQCMWAQALAPITTTTGGSA